MSIGHQVSAKLQTLKYVVSDWVTTAIAFILFNVARYHILNPDKCLSDDIWGYLTSTRLVWEEILIPTILLGIYWLSGYYNKPFGKSRLQELVTTFLSAMLNGMLIYLALLTNDQIVHRSANWGLILILIGLLFIFTYAGRFIITNNSRHQFKRHRWNINTLIIGNSAKARATARRLSRSMAALGYNVVGYVRIPGEKDADDEIEAYTFEQLTDLISEKNIDQLIISTEMRDEQTVLSILYRLFPLNLPIKITPDTLNIVTSNINLQDIYGEPFIDLTTPSISESTKNVKRLIDVVASGMALLLLMPVYIALAIAVKADSKGPVFYRQVRIGYRQKPFKIVKFRSMKTDAESAGPQLSSTDDPRVTRIGKTLRKYRLDELPQFWNVLVGDMSLVGPRPEREYFIREIVKQAPYYTLIHQVRPGITSWGMVKYGYASNVEQMVKRTRYDLIYLSNMSTAVDMKILIYTVKTIITGKGV